MERKMNRYSKLIEAIFRKYFKEGSTEVNFSRDDIDEQAKALGIKVPKNLGDVIYSFRYRTMLPLSIVKQAPEGFEWVINPAGKGLYKFELAKASSFLPNPNLARVKIPDSTPGIVSRYSLSDEQALLAKIRYNRLIDIFTGVTCYSLQNHLRTSVKEIGQVETDEIYVGIDKQGVHYMFPIQAKGSTDKIGTVQIGQDFAVCKEKFPNAVGRPIAAQFLGENVIVLMEFIQTEEGIKILLERQYHLVQPNDLSDDEIMEYRKYLSI